MPVVHINRARPDLSGVLAGNVVSAADWAAAGSLSNWLIGKGRTLVPMYHPGQGTLTWAGTTGGSGNNLYPFAFRYLLQPSYQAIERLWVFDYESEGPVAVSIAGGASTPYGADGISSFDEDLSTQSASEDDTVVGISTVEDLTIHSIGCWEYPRQFLEDNANELGTIVERLRRGQPITNQSVQRMRAVAAATTAGKRTHFHWAVPYAISGSTATTYVRSTTSTSFTTLFTDACHVLGRQTGVGDTTRSVKAKVYAWVTGGTAEVRMTSDVHGQTSNTVTISSTSPAWSSEITGQTVDAEDMSTDDGRRGGAWDGVSIQYRKVTSGTVYVASATIYE